MGCFYCGAVLSPFILSFFLVGKKNETTVQKEKLELFLRLKIIIKKSASNFLTASSAL